MQKYKIFFFCLVWGLCFIGLLYLWARHFLKSSLPSSRDRYEYYRGDIASKEPIFDLKTDTSLTKFVNNTISFDDQKYIPKDLLTFDSDFVHDRKWWNSLLRKEANIALQKLAEKFYWEFGKKLIVVSAYRSYEYQKGIKERGCPDTLCAKAWYSEHQSGLAVDFFSASTSEIWENSQELTKYFHWLQRNAYLYGFTNTYQKWKEIDGYVKEPWHRRYVWVSLASYLEGNNMTFAEYFYEKTK